jgi:glutaredoxin-like protein NrdH
MALDQNARTNQLRNQLQITVYTQPSCQPCKAVKRWLDRRAIPYQTVDVSESPQDLAAIKALGYTSVPVTVVNYGDGETELHWQGLVVDYMTKYIAKKAA